MPLTFANFLPPAGRLDPMLWPGEETRDVEARITGYITAALADPRIDAITDPTEQDVAATPFVNWLAYTDVVIRLGAQAASVSRTDKGSSAIIAQQLQIFQDLRAEAFGEFNDLLPGSGPEPLFPDTMSTKTDVRIYSGKAALT